MQSGDRVHINWNNKPRRYVMSDVLIHPANGRTDSFIINDKSISFDLCVDNINPDEQPGLLCYKCGNLIGKIKEMPMEWPEQYGGYVHAKTFQKTCQKCGQKYNITFGSYTG